MQLYKTDHASDVAALGTVLPAEVRSKSFHFVACGKEGWEDGGVCPPELVALFTVIHRQLLLALVLHDAAHVLNILNATLYTKSAPDAVVFLSITRKNVYFYILS
jgi:hypothetical protein